MSREAILSEIRSLERQKELEPHHAYAFDQQITALCDRLKQLSAWNPRRVV